MYIDKLIENNEIKQAIKLSKEKLKGKDYKKSSYAEKLSQIYLNNNMDDEYKKILYDIFYEYSNCDIDNFLKIKKLYSTKEWATEKIKIINKVKKHKYTNNQLNKIYIEEKMYDELFLNICNNEMDYIVPYEKYLLPKYNNQLLNIYKENCLIDAKESKNRSQYRKVAMKVNHIIQMKDSKDVTKELLNEINEKYLGSRTAMLDEFKQNIENFKDYY